MAHRALGGRLLAVTARSPIHARGESQAAADLARNLGVPHMILATDELAQPGFAANGPDRCYICKRNLFEALQRLAADRHIPAVAHGANADDRGDFRPGGKAAAEMGILAPLSEVDLTKAEIRRLARQMGLPNWNQPAMSCLATRVPYGSLLSQEKLACVEQAEEFMRACGFGSCRVRHHGTVARIELEEADWSRFLHGPTRTAVAERLRRLGFLHVAVDVEAYAAGRMNRVLELEGKP
jgi:uncharacterized protein